MYGRVKFVILVSNNVTFNVHYTPGLQCEVA